MSRAVRDFTVADIAAQFELASYRWGTTWCPAVHRKGDGFAVRVHHPRSTPGRWVFEYFELDASGLITSAPRGHAKVWRPGRVVDVAAVAEVQLTPELDAPRFQIGGLS